MVFSPTFPKKTRKNLLRVSRLFSTSRFCSDVNIQVFFSWTLASHAGCVYYTYMRTHLLIYEVFNKTPYSKFFCISHNDSPNPKWIFECFLFLYRFLRTSWHTGWKVLNCLTNTTEIMRKKGKHGKSGFLFEVFFLGQWTRLFLLCKYRMLLK